MFHFSYTINNLTYAFCRLYLSRIHSLRRIALSEKYFRELPQHHQQLLTGFCDDLAAIRTCIEHNYEIIKLLIADTDHLFENRLDYYDTVSIWFCVITFICFLYNLKTYL